MKVIYSAEKPLVGLVKLDEEQVNNPSEFGAVENFRLRTIPVIGTMPAIMGQAMAAYCLMELGNKPINVLSTDNLSESMKTKMLDKLRRREREVFKYAEAGYVIDEHDTNIIFSEVWRCRSAVSGVKMGRSKMALTRWDKSKVVSISNCVLLTEKEADIHDAAVDNSYLPKEVVDGINATLKSAAEWYS